MPVKKATDNRKQETSRSKKVSTPAVKARTVAKADGVTVDVFDVKGKVVGKTSLPKEMFAAKVNSVLMAQAVRVYLANQRKGTASTKTRGEVTASTRKIYRQKGTGRARHGGISAPIFVGGGIAFGPKPRDYSLNLPKKMKRQALASALTSKAKDQAIKVVEGLEKLGPKTKGMYQTLKNVAGEKEKGTRKILLVIPGKVENVQRSARNIEGVTIRPANLLNTYEVLNNATLLFMKDAIQKLEETWNKQVS